MAAIGYAAGEGATAATLSTFFGANGGIVACAKRERQKNPHPVSKKAEEKRAALREERRKAGVVVKNAPLQRIAGGAAGTLKAVLFETRDDGTLLLLGQRAEDAGSVGVFDPLL